MKNNRERVSDTGIHSCQGHEEKRINEEQHKQFVLYSGVKNYKLRGKFLDFVFNLKNR